MQSIITKYHGPTNTLGSRISATTSYGNKRIYVHYGHSGDAIDNHKRAFKTLLDTLDWSASEYVMGSTPDGYVFVPVVDTIETTKRG